MPYKAILLDIDGTLVDSNDFHVLAWDQALRDAGHEFDRETLHAQIGKGADNYVSALLPDLEQGEAHELGKAHGQYFKQRYFDQLKAFPGARELIERCKDRGLKVILASSASSEELDHHLEVIRAKDLVDGHTSADDVRRSKPCPDIFEAALAKAGVKSEEAVVIGDTPYDIAAARKAGMDAIAVRSGGFPDEALQGAIAIYDDVVTLLARFDASPLSVVEEAF